MIFLLPHSLNSSLPTTPWAGEKGSWDFLLHTDLAWVANQAYHSPSCSWKAFMAKEVKALQRATAKKGTSELCLVGTPTIPNLRQKTGDHKNEGVQPGQNLKIWGKGKNKNQTKHHHPKKTKHHPPQIKQNPQPDCAGKMVIPESMKKWVSSR